MTTDFEPLLFEISRPGRLAVELPACDVPVLPLDSLLPPHEPAPRPAAAGTVRAGSDPALHASVAAQLLGGFRLLPARLLHHEVQPEDQRGDRASARLRPHPSVSCRTPPFRGRWKSCTRCRRYSPRSAAWTRSASSRRRERMASCSGLMLIKAYHDDHGQGHRDTILCPEAAHGTNPASAARCGYKTVTVKSDARGRVDLDAPQDSAG